MIRIASGLSAAALALAACGNDAAETPVVAQGPNVAEQTCLLAVTRETGNPDVVLLGSQFSEAGTLVRVGVGEARAPWQCIAYDDGTTGGIMFMGDEGAL